MELGEAKKDTRKQTLLDAKLLMKWLYNKEDDYEDVNNLDKSFLEELKLLTGKCIGVVEIIAEFTDGKKCTGRAYLRDIVETGMELPDDIANFHIEIKVLRTDESKSNIKWNYNQQIFKSDIFYVIENTKTKVDESDGVIIESMAEFSSRSGGNIRFKGYENVIEI